VAPAPSVYACCLAAGYIALKARVCLPVFDELLQSLRSLLLGRRCHGTAVPPQEALEAGAQCCG
jgi:hypothetical protein